MNIYINVEISVRELDSNLLLAVLAAAKGHQVIVSDSEGIIKGINSGVLAPGIFHTKSLTPAPHKIARHEALVEKDFIITSIDEEAGLDVSGFQEFAITRFSDKTIDQATALFGWGSSDTDALKKLYHRHSSKIHKTGSPRSDLWKSLFRDYWGMPKKAPEKPFLLVSSNMFGANGIVPFHEIIKSKRAFGYYERDKKLLKKEFIRTGEAYFKTEAFIAAIKHLATKNNGYDIVLRPHPTEDIEAWRVYLEGIPNVHIIKEGSISGWVHNAFAIMHCNCTTALEATISNKPVVTYDTFKQTFYGDAPPNKLGYLVKTREELLSKVNMLFDDMRSGNKKNISEKDAEEVAFKIYTDNNELAAEKIVNVWDSLVREDHSRSSNWTKFYWLLKAISLRKMLGKVLRGLLQSKFNSHKDNNKFPALNSDDINERVIRLQRVLGIEGLKVKLLSDRTILIKR